MSEPATYEAPEILRKWRTAVDQVDALLAAAQDAHDWIVAAITAECQAELNARPGDVRITLGIRKARDES